MFQPANRIIFLPRRSQSQNRGRGQPKDNQSDQKNDSQANSHSKEQGIEFLDVDYIEECV